MVSSTKPFNSRSIGTTATKFCVELNDTSDGTYRRISYVTIDTDSKMWRVEEVRHDDSWRIVDTKQIDSLRVSFPESRSTSPFEETV